MIAILRKVLNATLGVPGWFSSGFIFGNIEVSSVYLELGINIGVLGVTK